MTIMLSYKGGSFAMHWAKSVLVMAIPCAVWVVSPGVAAAQDQPRFSVMGVVIKGSQSIAWIGEPTYTKDNFVRVSEGDRLGPYQILRIREDRVELTGPSGPMVVRLSASAPDSAKEPSGQGVSAAVETPPPAAARIPDELVAAARAKAREFKAQYPSEAAFHRLRDYKPLRK
jgi:hypothetical protein